MKPVFCNCCDWVQCTLISSQASLYPVKKNLEEMVKKKKTTCCYPLSQVGLKESECELAQAKIPLKRFPYS